MKIYATRQRSGADILDSLVGTDKWIKVYLHSQDEEYYIRVLTKGSFAITEPAYLAARSPLYYCNIIPAKALTGDVVFSKDGFEYNLQRQHAISLFRMDVILPVTIYSTDELRDMVYIVGLL